MRDVSKIRLKAARKLFFEWVAAIPPDTKPLDYAKFSALLSDWMHMTRHLERWERVHELRAQFGKTIKVREIRCIVAEETSTTSVAVDKSCKDVENLKKRIEGCVARLNGKLRTAED